jgi:trehalose-6-phosphatase
MLDRLISLLLLWAMEGCLAWGVAHEYAAIVNQKLTLVLRALNAL